MALKHLPSDHFNAIPELVNGGWLSSRLMANMLYRTHRPG